jgi:hypothetical protein
MTTKYDRKTLNKTYSVLNKTLKRLEEQEIGFKKEVKRYTKMKDVENMDNAYQATQEIQFAKDQIQKVKELMSKEFRGKTK